MCAGMGGGGGGGGKLVDTISQVDYKVVLMLNEG